MERLGGVNRKARADTSRIRKFTLTLDPQQQSGKSPGAALRARVANNNQVFVLVTLYLEPVLAAPGLVSAIQPLADDPFHAAGTYGSKHIAAVTFKCPTEMDLFELQFLQTRFQTLAPFRECQLSNVCAIDQ